MSQALPNLTPAFKILIFIRTSEKRNEPVWYSKLLTQFEGHLNGLEISKELDKMYDLGLIDGEWKKVENKWTRCFNVSKDGTELADALVERYA